MYQQIEDNELIEVCYQNCRENLNSLVNCDINNFNVYIISEGVFLCSINDQSTNRNLLLRLDKLNPLKNTLITSPKSAEIISAFEFHQNELGPALLSVFKNGRIEEWINGQPLGNRYRFNKDKQKLVAYCIARIHSIKTVATERNGHFLSNKVNVFLKLIYKNKTTIGFQFLLDFLNTNLNYNQNEDEKIIALENEFKFLTSNLVKLDCLNQIVFSHNDLSQENIYQRADALDKLYVLNYDLAGFNFRGYDLAHYLNNTAFDFNSPPNCINQLNWIMDGEIHEFVDNYLAKFKQLNANFNFNLNNLIKEVKFFKIYSSYLSILVSILTTLTNEPIDSNLAFLKLRIDIYLKQKTEFINCYPEFCI